jgi:hypothetical protein
MAAIANEENKIYGAFWNKGSSPAMIRTDSAKGSVANAGTDAIKVYNEFDQSSIFDWEEDEDAYGNQFMRIPPIYIGKERGTNYLLNRVSRKPFDGAYLPWCNWDFANNKPIDLLYGKFKGSLSADGTKLESKLDVYPLINKNIVDFRNLAKANGKGYQQLDIHAVDLVQTLYQMEFATLNSQSVCAGFTNGKYTNTDTATVAENNTNRIIVANATANYYAIGQTISIGTSQGGNQIFYGRTITSIDVYDASNKAISFDGTPVNIAIGNYLYNTGWKNGFSKDIASSVGSLVSNTDGLHPFVWHGIESLFGDVWQFVDGININEHQSWVCKNADNYISNVFSAPYEQLGYVNSASDGYSTAMGYDPNLPFAEFPVLVGGNSSTYYSDYYYQTTGQRIALVGGSWPYGSDAGLSAWELAYSSAVAGVNVGGRLLKKPL